MSSVAESPDGMALQSYYSLRWNNHQTHILQAFEALLHAEILFDVTLVCSESSIRAHKVVLSACSPFFERIFAEHPCKHPVILLKDFPSREIAALIDFMYRGEVRVGREDLSSFMRAGKSLQIRGLTSPEMRLASPPATPTTDLLGQTSTPEGARQGTPEEDDNVSESTTPASRDIFPRDHRLPHMSHLNFSLRELRDSCGSALKPRRKQARPRRRSDELVSQDLSRPHPPVSIISPPSSGLNLSNNQQQQQQHQSSPNQQEDIAENLSMKRRSVSPAGINEHNIKTESEDASSPRGPPLTGTNLHAEGSLPDLGGAAGHFPHGALDRRSLLADLHDSFKHETLHGPFGGAILDHYPGKKPKKHQGDGNGPRRWGDHRRGLPVSRPKGQHSAPGGGYPRSWTNAKLTEALQHVWSKKMNAYRASRIFGIPYNSLLNYVKGRYGKSLNLEQLRRDCTGATTGEVMNSLNNNVKAPVQPPQMPHPLPGMPHPGDDNPFPHHPLLGGNLPQGFFPVPAANAPGEGDLHHR